jgi:hypothetical protein
MGRQNNMKRFFSFIAHCALSALTLFFLALSEPAIAAPFIRIIGDRPPVAPRNFSGPTAAEPPSSSVRGSTIIRIIGDKQGTVQRPASKQAARPEPDQSTSTVKETRVIGDTAEAIQKQAPEQPPGIETAEKEHKAKRAVEGESLSREAAEQQLAQRLESLKAEVERKAAEKAEHERLAQLKGEQENAAAMQAAIEQEQEQLATGMILLSWLSDSDLPLEYVLMQTCPWFQERWHLPCATCPILSVPLGERWCNGLRNARATIRGCEDSYHHSGNLGFRNSLRD